MLLQSAICTNCFNISSHPSSYILQNAFDQAKNRLDYKIEKAHAYIKKAIVAFHATF